ncbi:hypothetical protein D5H75_29200 [Bailinhaonella thermotolerans]|uniref:DUF308 domain-containing protein n=1 Tax=Bailinhaonella thermotolerans TaxID=1070861 RepID=A0A3A4A8Z5_9ACTN|nr:hypothetical protein D5H75_29200 [Bailinhaonella thermotolerans]
MTEPGWLFALYFVLFPVIGAAALWVVKLIVDWGAATLSWLPFEDIVKFLASIPDPQATLGALALGAAGGLFVAFMAKYESLEVLVSPEGITLTRKGESRTIPADRVNGAFWDGKALVLLGRDGGELARETSDLKEGPVHETLTAHGYTWLDGDPYREEFRRWVEGVPGLPPGADALLKARAKALEKDDAHDIAELRDELARLGVVVRDHKKRQHYRLVERSPGDE